MIGLLPYKGSYNEEDANGTILDGLGGSNISVISFFDYADYRIMSTEEKKQAFLDNYPKLLVATQTAQAIGIDESCHYRWIADDEKYKLAFQALKKEIDTRRLEENLKEVHRRGLEKSDLLLMFETKALAPELYREKVENKFVGDVKIIVAIPGYDESLRLTEVKQLKEGENATE